MNASNFTCLITAGPTREYVDPVRFFSNASSGKMGYALASAAVERGWSVDLVSGPVCLAPPSGVSFHPVVTAAEMESACRQLFPACDLLVMCAAVADYRPVSPAKRKIKKKDESLVIHLEPTVDIAKALATEKRHQLCVGFAAETDHIEAHARKKLREKNLDWIVANDVSSPEIGMEADQNRVTLFSVTGESRSFGPAPKSDVADFILGAIMGAAPRG